MDALAYLCCTDYEGIYPSAVLEDFDFAISTIATDGEGVPLLWPALFRAEDFFVETFDGEDGEFEECAPMVEKSRALANLASARRFYTLAFSGLGALDEHFDLFERAVREAPGRFVTIELEALASQQEDPSAFYDDFEALLARFAETPAEDDVEAFLELAGYEPGTPFPPARLLLDALSEEDDAHFAHARIFGEGAYLSGIGRPVPWEPKP